MSETLTAHRCWHIRCDLCGCLLGADSSKALAVFQAMLAGGAPSGTPLARALRLCKPAAESWLCRPCIGIAVREVHERATALERTAASWQSSVSALEVHP